MKSKFLFLSLILGIIAVLTACDTASKVVTTPMPSGSAIVQADMGKYNQCLSQMNSDCMASLFAPRGAVYDTGLLQASGPDAIRSYMNQSFNTAHLDSLTATIDSVMINGGVGVVLGVYDEKTTNATGQSSETKQRYVAEWIDQSNGQWLLNRVSTVILH